MLSGIISLIAANFVEHLPFLSYIYLYRDEIHLSYKKFHQIKSIYSDSQQKVTSHKRNKIDISCIDIF